MLLNHGDKIYFIALENWASSRISLVHERFGQVLSQLHPDVWLVLIQQKFLLLWQRGVFGQFLKETNFSYWKTLQSYQKQILIPASNAWFRRSVQSSGKPHFRREKELHQLRAWPRNTLAQALTTWVSEADLRPIWTLFARTTCETPCTWPGM